MPTHTHTVNLDTHSYWKCGVQTQSGDFPHLLLYGPASGGKKTRAAAVVTQLYGAECRPRAKEMGFSTRSSGGSSLRLSVLSGPHHVQLNPASAGNIVLRPVLLLLAYYHDDAYHLQGKMIDWWYKKS